MRVKGSHLTILQVVIWGHTFKRFFHAYPDTAQNLSLSLYSGRPRLLKCFESGNIVYVSTRIRRGFEHEQFWRCVILFAEVTFKIAIGQQADRHGFFLDNIEKKRICLNKELAGSLTY